MVLNFLLELLLKRKPKLPWLVQRNLAYLVTLVTSRHFAPQTKGVESYCTFIGHSRSGHSLIAALLDAHPEIVVAHELRAVRYIQCGFGRDALYYLLFQQTKVRGHSWKRGSGG